MTTKQERDEYIIIVGCGRLGSHLARLLSKARKSVVVIDKNEYAFHRLSNDFSGFTLEADAIEIDSLLRAKIDKADVVVATTDDDNTNVMIAQIAKTIYHVPKVIARLFEPSRQQIYEQLDIETLCPTILSAEALRNNIIGEETEDLK
ncbi:potassium channel family protein [Geosporobacter ferrireducens]|uniref:Potassium transporter TrkA n=1 Tax=Geosporobacter ferrireducens TaxID=1424294 RepID=A0A1D8GDP7_9FIRM|nr:TrkA family potassium uptake protein [Geosporobacter ferrireducens]AOT69045.1 potassium transporter TrkA [Geosporobacter ferrireducens]MTI56713.1 TrkA family potassium uptake protein [Geosporobacter ferrireducens]